MTDDSSNSPGWQKYINYLFPREVIGPVIVVFSLEGVIDGIFSATIPQGLATVAWCVIFLFSIALIAYWGEADEDREEMNTFD